MTLHYENKKIRDGYQYVIGCDEVGRGSLAGPVVASVIALDLRFNLPAGKAGIEELRLKDIKDSKLLTPKKREELSRIIKQHSAWSVAEVSSVIIDEINIHQATLLAMRRAIKSLLQKMTNEKSKVFIYIDGQFKVPECDYDQESVIGGDNKVLSIAAASIVAKVHRDNLMERMHKFYPKYNFAQNKGYGTLFHRQMIQKHGLSPIHRLSFCQSIAV